MSKQTLMTLSLALTSVLGLGACDSIQPGEYSVFRVSYGESAQDLACGVTDPTLVTLPTGDSYGDPETLVIFAHDDVYYLEYEGLGVDGLVTLEGVRDGKSYSFLGTEVSYELLDEAGTSFLTTSEALEVVLDVDGKNIDGSVTHTTTISCLGAVCPTIGFPQSCTTTQPFAGSLVPDAQVEVGI